MNVHEARATIRAERTSWAAMVALLRGASVSPVVEWRCRKGCMYLAVYPAPDGRKVVWLPGRRRSADLAAKLAYDGTRSEPLAAELETFLASTDADLFLVSCRHYEFDESLARLRADAARPGPPTERELPDGDTPMTFVGPRAQGRTR